MRILGKIKQLVFTVNRLARGKKLPAKRREFRALSTIENRAGAIPAVLQNISETGLCLVIEEASLPEEFTVRMASPLERKIRRLRCRKVWATGFVTGEKAYVRIGCAFHEPAYRLRWLADYLNDDLSPISAENAEEAA